MAIFTSDNTYDENLRYREYYSFYNGEGVGIL